MTRDNPDQARDVQRIALSILNSMSKLSSRPIVKPILMRRVLCAIPAVLVLGAVPCASVAQLQVQITGVGSQQFPISIATFARDGQAPPAEIDSIIRADLARSGLFRIVDAGTQTLAENASVNFGEWRLISLPMRWSSAASHVSQMVASMFDIACTIPSSRLSSTVCRTSAQLLICV